MNQSFRALFLAQYDFVRSYYLPQIKMSKCRRDRVKDAPVTFGPICKEGLCSFLLFFWHLVSVWTFGVMYDHTFSELATHQIIHQATHKWAVSLVIAHLPVSYSVPWTVYNSEHKCSEEFFKVFVCAEKHVISLEAKGSIYKLKPVTS